MWVQKWKETFLKIIWKTQDSLTKTGGRNKLGVFRILIRIRIITIYLEDEVANTIIPFCEISYSTLETLQSVISNGCV